MNENPKTALLTPLLSSFGILYSLAGVHLILLIMNAHSVLLSKNIYGSLFGEQANNISMLTTSLSAEIYSNYNIFGIKLAIAILIISQVREISRGKYQRTSLLRTVLNIIIALVARYWLGEPYAALV